VDESSVDESFPEIAALAEGCRFADCGHSGEPGCAVEEALAAGSLDRDRYESYLDSRREARYHQMRGSASAKRVERAKWKAISKFQRNFGKEREER
jgi:ribosome biogenesis GTPase